jgi:hypothetical protein
MLFPKPLYLDKQAKLHAAHLANPDHEDEHNILLQEKPKE